MRPVMELLTEQTITHVHYEIFKDGERINPINFYYGNLSPEEFDVILQKAQLENQSLD